MSSAPEWKTWEVRTLIEMRKEGYSYREILPYLDNRSEYAARRKGKRLHIMTHAEAMALKAARLFLPDDPIQKLVSDGVDAGHSAKQIATRLVGLGHDVTISKVYRRIEKLPKGDRKAFREAGARRRGMAISLGHKRRKALARQQEKTACKS